MKQILQILIVVFCAFPAHSQSHFQVFFDFNKDMPNETSSVALNDWIKANPEAEITKLSGYADSVDVNGYNVTLSLRRIKTVQGILEAGNIKLRQPIEILPYGEDFKQSPVQAENRRVDIVYTIPKKEIPVVADMRKRDAVVEFDEPDATIEVKFSKAKKGDIIRLRNINFFLNSEVVVPESEPRIDELYTEMVKNPNLSIEIHGHICCNPNTRDTKLSFRRAKYIFSYLLKKGIPLNRLAFKGFGSSRPIHRIPERTYKEEAENRRVEILIVNI